MSFYPQIVLHSQKLIARHSIFDTNSSELIIPGSVLGSHDLQTDDWTAESSGYGGQEQQDRKPIFRSLGEIDGGDQIKPLKRARPG